MLGTVTVESRRDVATDTATSETVIDQEELDARNASTLPELIDTVPGVTLSNAATPQGSSINIRGLGADAGTYGSNTKVSVVVDGVSKGQEEIYRQGSILTFEPELFKEVRVIRGPGESFRWSSGAIGGTVEAVTKDAADFLEGDDTFAFRQKFGLQSNGESYTTSSILAWAPDDRLDVIGFYGYRTANDYEGSAGNRVPDTEYLLQSALVKATYRFNDALSLTGSFSRNENTLRDISYDTIGSTFPVRVDADVEDTTAYIALNYNPIGNDLIDASARLVYSDELFANVSDVTSSTIYNADNRTERLALILENQALFSTGQIEHSLLTGIEFGVRERTAVSSNGGLNAGSTPGGTDEYIAVYTSDEMRFGALTLTPQLRFESQTITSENNEPTAPPDGTEFDADGWAGAISAFYEVTDSFAVFGTAAYNINLPIIDDLTNAERIVTTEKAVTYEAGVSYAVADAMASDDRLGLKLTAFDTRIWDNTTYTNFNPAPDANDDEILIHGVEFELSYAHPQFYVNFNAARIRADWGDGSPFNNAPADSAQLTIGKSFMDEQLDLALEIRHDWSTDRNIQFSGASEESDSFTVYTLSGAYRPTSGVLAGAQFQAAVENLTNEDYQPYLSSRVAPGRNIKFSVAKVF